MADTKHSVFISYSHKDRETVKNLIDAFDRQEISYWSDQQIRAGENWKTEIENALNQASIFVILVSPDFAASDWAMYEIGHAISRSRETGAKLIPIIIREGKIPGLLQRFQWIDARSMKPDEVAMQIKSILEKR